MKLAILGGSPIALEAALRFHFHGAALSLYFEEEGFAEFDSFDLPAASFTSDLGMGVLKETSRTYAPRSFSWENWSQDYQKPILDYLKVHQEVKTDEVVSITKRFLARGEEIPGRSRFLDLFRIIYQVNPQEFIESQKETDPEIYQRLTEEFVNSLASTIEMYQDYDLVLDFRTDLGRASAAASGRALGENRPSDKVSYGIEALKKSKALKASPELREIAIIGSDSLAAEILIDLTEWMKEPRSQLFIVTTEEEPFLDFLKKANPESARKLRELFQEVEEEFEREIETFSKKLRDWQELDDFVQVKITRPVEPIPRLNYFSGHNVSAIDELIDRKRMFLTLERPEFRQGKKHPENNHLELKTVGVDHILVAHAKKDYKKVELEESEIGYFDLTPARPTLSESWESDLVKLEGIEDEIFKLFSPADAHQL